ncbi:PHOSPHATIDYLETHANOLAMINE N-METHYLTRANSFERASE [Salix koriyanagi]|uniref:phosphatidyl-N-methylethanolamine N-methyltransferase n=1 Tax=Salix koriyanagi TaxID=2511006 RepID=A0A9Q0Q964_9ROSI|nr:PHOSPHATIDYLETHANOLAMINE N-METHYLTRANSFERASE [Salix koriyanagi]
MGEPMWEIQEPIEGYVLCFTFPKVAAVHFPFFSFHSLLASSSLLLAPLWLWSVPQLQLLGYLMVIGPIPTHKASSLTKGRIDPCIYDTFLENIRKQAGHTSMVYQLLGESGTYYGVRFGKNIPWVTEFPFGVIQDPQYVGSILSLFACLSWTPFQYILLWTLGYAFMIYVESKEDPATRAKPVS